MRVLVLGGDGYLGWPLAMKLSHSGHDVSIADNYLRRKLTRSTNSAPLVEFPDLHERRQKWLDYTGKNLNSYIGDLRDWDFISKVFQQTSPDCVVHLAEQPSAPYSMFSRESATLTLRNNLEATANVIFAVREYCPDSHIVKLGTMGEYGTPNIDIEEGWLDVTHNERNHTFLYPRQASSLYHTTKIMDTDLLWFYTRAWGIRVTDLMQGPVYGLFTDENRNHLDLLPHFNYDEMFGTVINRFNVQAVIGHPLTVYGRGGQTRGYLNIQDSLNSIELALNTPPSKGELRIFNQFVETFSVNQIAKRIRQAAEKLSLPVSIKSIPNPRNELEDHYYNPKHIGLLELGLKPHYLKDEVIIEMIDWVSTNKNRVVESQILQGIKWN